MRLAPSEVAAVTVVGVAQTLRGRWDERRRYVSSASDARDRELRFDARAMFKLGPVQLGGIFPWVRTDRRFGDQASGGSGIGDLTLLSRYDFVRVGGQNGIPGIAFTYAMSFPTGRSPDRARDPLGTDATGTGAYEARPGFAIERTWWTGWFVTGVASLGFSAPYRRSDGATVALGPRFLALVAGGKSFSNGLGFTLGVSHEHEEGPRVDAIRVSGVRSRTSALSLVSYEIDDHWQATVSLLVDIPLRHLGRDQLANTTIGFAIRRAWNVY